MLTLYWYASFNPQKVRLALEELGLEYSLVTVDLTRGGQHTDLIGELNPNRKVPILVDGQCIGAVGVSGVKASEDAEVARAGIAAL